MPVILLISENWTTRALLRAQLIEEGFSVEAHESMVPALGSLWARREMPSLMIADLYESENPTKDISILAQWTALVPVWVMAAHGVIDAGALEGRSFEKVLFRPLDMKSLLREIKERLAV